MAKARKAQQKSEPMESWSQAPHQPREDDVRNRAYNLWEQEGRPEGRHDEHWQQAERELKTVHPDDPNEVPQESSSFEEKIPVASRRRRNKRD